MQKEPINKPTKRFEPRFWAKTQKTKICWLWIGARDTMGYGQISIAGKMEMAHRVSYIIHFGNIPAKQKILHRCDIRSCVRPEHLFIGTQADNMRDAYQKGKYLGWYSRVKPFKS